MAHGGKAIYFLNSILSRDKWGLSDKLQCYTRISEISELCDKFSPQAA